MKERKVTGLVPAAGQATRIAPLPVSKELYPIGFRVEERGKSLRPKVVCRFLLENMRRAGITKAYIILRSGKWDIPAYFGDGVMLNMHLGYLIMGLPYGVPYTLDQAYPFVQDTLVALGFPDILFQHFDAGGRVHFVVEKPSQSDLRHMWAVAVWTPVFTHFMHEYLAGIEANKWQSDTGSSSRQQEELKISDVVQAGIDRGLRVEAEVFTDGKYLDIGTPEDLVQAVRHFANQENW